ncbi:MAG: glycosyltransferase [Chloroflexota bacterium]
MTPDSLTLSVVVAARNGRATVEQCLQALEAQRPDGIAEIILVDNSSDGTASVVRERFPEVELVRVAGSALVPRLWAEGALRARQPIVALTTAQMAVQPGWARALIQHHQARDGAGVGGPILPAPGLRLADQAVYWLRFAHWGERNLHGPSRELAGDNASYRRARILDFGEAIRRDGFWETEFHAWLRRSGERLDVASDASVHFLGQVSIRELASQRLIHGRRFGAGRVASRSFARRMLFVLAWPLTPAVFLARLFARARRLGGATSFVRSSPWLLYLLAWWSTGELLGYLTGEVGHDSAPAEHGLTPCPSLPSNPLLQGEPSSEVARG